MKEKRNLQSLNQPDCFLTTSKGIAALAVLPALLGAPVYYCRSARQLTKLRQQFSRIVMLAWGRKPSASLAEQFAKQYALTLWRVEDGFLRSIELGHQCEPLSVVVDDIGIYYDGRSSSRLEQLIATPWLESEYAQRSDRAERVVQAWRSARVSKYNASRELLPLWLSEAPFVLVVDQTYADASIAYGAADAERFQVMLAAACAQYANHRIVIKTHPDVMAGTKKAHFAPNDFSQNERIRFLATDIHPPAILERADAVFCVTSQMGFEALLWGKPTHVFGLPFYAGWGLTHDFVSCPERRHQTVSLAKLVSAALIEYPRYVHPETKSPCEFEEVIPWFGLQRVQRERFPAHLWAGYWPRWKRQALKTFLSGSELSFSGRNGVNTEQLWSVGWGAKATTTIRVEDGFVRSVGLGADLVTPQSWVIDRRGMYYDASRPSDLEHLLLTHQFTTEERQRAERLVHRLVHAKVSKYNVGRATWRRPNRQQTVILIPGQVESDASIELGSPVIKSNLELIENVRKSNPDAYLVYKPHPDVQAGLRIAGSAEQSANAYVDEVVLDEDMAHLLEHVDEVHTMTSLTGFEALLRGVDVHCYGQPFYAGWGLTSDRIPPTRRQRQLTLSELVAGALILYPTYVSRTTQRFTTVERVLTELVEYRESAQKRTSVQRIFRYACQVPRRFLQQFKRF